MVGVGVLIVLVAVVYGRLFIFAINCTTRTHQ